MMNIGKAAQASGVSAKMIRYYERIGLIPEAQRSANGYRVYADADIHTLRFIRRARDLGFSMSQIAQLVQLWHNQHRASAEVKQIALQHVGELDHKIEQLRTMRETLSHLAQHCQGNARPDCPILEDLARGG